MILILSHQQNKADLLMPLNNTVKIPLKVVEATMANSSEGRPASLPENKHEVDETPKSDTNFKSIKPEQQQNLIELPVAARVAFLILFVLFVVIGATYFWAINSPAVPQWIAPMMTILWVLSGIGVLTLLYLMWLQFRLFCDDLTVWSNSLLKGDLSARMTLRNKRCPSKGIRLHIN